MPGTAQALARVFSSRTYGQNCAAPSAASWFGAVAKSTCRSGSVVTSGKSHGSDPFAKYPSDNTNTGVRYFVASRAASIAAAKQSDGD